MVTDRHKWGMAPPSASAEGVFDETAAGPSPSPSCCSSDSESMPPLGQVASRQVKNASRRRMHVHRTVGVLTYAALAWAAISGIYTRLDDACVALGTQVLHDDHNAGSSGGGGGSTGITDHCTGIPDLILRAPNVAAAAVWDALRTYGTALFISTCIGCVLSVGVFYGRNLLNKRILRQIMREAPVLEVVHPSDCRKSDVVFAWDIHGVLAAGSASVFLRAFVNPKNLHSLLHFAVFSINPYAIFRVLRYCITSEVTDEVLARIGSEFPYMAPIGTVIIAFSNSFSPNMEVFTLIKELRSRGYHKHYIFSNIGEKVFLELSSIYPIFSTFDGCMVATAARNYIHKPFPFYYYMFHTQFGAGVPSPKVHDDEAEVVTADESCGPTTVVFVDDKNVNVEAGRLNGMYSLRYTSPAQLRREFVASGLLDALIVPS